MNNSFYTAWITQIYERDTFYLYVLAIVATGYLYYRWWRLWRFFKYVMAVTFLIVSMGILWGLSQLLEI